MDVTWPADISFLRQAYSAHRDRVCASRVLPTGFNDRAWLARNLVQVRPNEERLSPSAGPAGGSCLLVCLSCRVLLQANDPRHTPPSTKIVASIIFTLPINSRLSPPVTGRDNFRSSLTVLAPTTTYGRLLSPILFSLIILKGIR